jgi:cytolysin-activating lysine-acyltransferase
MLSKWSKKMSIAPVVAPEFAAPPPAQPNAIRYPGEGRDPQQAAASAMHAGEANGSGPSNPQFPGPKAPSDNPFNLPPPEGHAKTMSQVLGEIVWLMSQSPIHKQMFIADLEWLVMAPAMYQQFRLYYDSGDAKNAPKPIGVVFWAEVDSEVAGRLSQGVGRLRPQDWKSGTSVPEDQRQLWVVEVIAPFGGAEAMVKELKAKVFPAREVRFVKVGPEGKSVGVL